MPDRYHIEQVPANFLPVAFSKIGKQLRHVLDNGGNWITAEVVFDSLVQGILSLYMVYDGEEEVAFFITENVNSPHGWFLSIAYSWVSPQHPDVRSWGLRQVESMAKKVGFSGTMFTSKRKGFDKVGPAEGYEFDLCRYVKEFSDG